MEDIENTMFEYAKAHGLECQVSHLLPYPESLPVCDIVTKKEVSIYTGYKVSDKIPRYKSV